MKTGKRSVPLDMLSVSEDGVSVSIHTHKSKLVATVVDGCETRRLEMDFMELFTIFDHWFDGHNKVETFHERSRSTGVEEGK